MTSDQTVPDESNLWSDNPRPKYPLIRVKSARNTLCARSALETVSDQTFPGRKDLWSDQNQTIVQKIVRPWPRQNPDHRPDDCALMTRLACSISCTSLLLIKAIKLLMCLWSECCFLLLLAETTSLGEKKNKKLKKKFSSKWSLIRLMCAWNRVWSDHSQPEVNSDHTIHRPKWPLIIQTPDRSDLWSYHPQTEVTSDHTIPRPKWPLIIPSPVRSDLWSYHPQTDVTSDHTIVRSNQIPDLVILVWEHTVCVGLGLIRGHSRMAPQPGYYDRIRIKLFGIRLANNSSSVQVWKQVYVF